MILAKENAALSACLEAAPPVAPSYPSTDPRAPRLAKFKREQLVVDTLNRGVSVTEIAARVGVGEKRMRAVIRDPRTGIRGLARRMPHPPAEFVAIQLSRLNEALLVAYSAMTPANPKAVDQVVKIVRELDRYGGAFAAEWARPEASSRIIPGSRPGNPGLDAPAEGAAALGAAWVCGAELALQAGELNLPPEYAGACAGAESAKPASEPVAIARTGELHDPLSPLQRGEGWGEGPWRLAAAARPAPHPGRLPVNGEKGPVGARSENLAQEFEKVESAPGISTLVAALAERDDAVVDRVYKPVGARERPGIQPQTSEKIDSAPEFVPLAPLQRGEGWGEGLGLLAADARPAPHPSLLPVIPGSSQGREKGDLPSADNRPENLAQRLENIESAPGNRPLDEAGSGSFPSPLIPYPIGPGRFLMTLNGVGAC